LFLLAAVQVLDALWVYRVEIGLGAVIGTWICVLWFWRARNWVQRPVGRRSVSDDRF
jgi:hypothetical protein